MPPRRAAKLLVALFFAMCGALVGCQGGCEDKNLPTGYGVDLAAGDVGVDAEWFASDAPPPCSAICEAGVSSCTFQAPVVSTSLACRYSLTTEFVSLADSGGDSAPAWLTGDATPPCEELCRSGVIDCKLVSRVDQGPYLWCWYPAHLVRVCEG